MMLDMKKVLSELAEARRPCDDLAHLIRSDFVAAEGEKFTRDVLNVSHAQAEPHQLGADRHQTAAHQPSQTAIVAGRRDGGFRAGYSIDQGLNFVAGTLVAKELQNDADGFFSHSIIDAGLYGQPSYQFVHNAPPSTGDAPAPCLSKLILIFCDPNYKRSAHLIVDRIASVAAMQERLRIFPKNCRDKGHWFRLLTLSSTAPVDPLSSKPGF
jgi:hypothetical protein